MASLYRIVDSAGSVIREYALWMRCEYVDATDPERRDPISTQVAYCKICADFVHAEQFLTAAECERIIERERPLDEEGGEALRIREMLYGSHEQFAQNLRVEALRIPGRVSTPRCLTCGSSEVLVEVKERFFGEGRLYHPDFLPDGISVHWVGFAGSELEVDDANRFYDREGNRLKDAHE
jgi:hypothetical protein